MIVQVTIRYANRIYQINTAAIKVVNHVGWLFFVEPLSVARTSFNSGSLSIKDRTFSRKASIAQIVDLKATAANIPRIKMAGNSTIGNDRSGNILTSRAAVPVNRVCSVDKGNSPLST
ncbi:hypothetical protein D3C78_1424790 [compost metagenome]